MDLFELLQGQVALFLLLMARISGIFIIAPFFGSMNIPILFRVGATLSFTILLFPVIDKLGIIDPPATIYLFAGSVLLEVFVGWLIGLVVYIGFSAIHMAGKIMDMQVGFSIVNVLDPASGQQVPLIGSFLYNLTLLIFLIINGHHMILTALVESFRTVPILSAAPSLSLTPMMTDFVSGVFVTGMQIAMPVTFAILLTNTGLGILARTMPQLNIFVVGIPMQIMIGIMMLLMSVPFYVMFLDVLFDGVYGNISLALKALL